VHAHLVQGLAASRDGRPLTMKPPLAYDHKKMGITARGAFEAVKHHFADLGVDIERQPFTVVGIGDMGGDVFGNGMLLSRHIQLVGAFNHQHIFLDRTRTPRRASVSAGASSIGLPVPGPITIRR